MLVPLGRVSLHTTLTGYINLSILLTGLSEPQRLPNDVLWLIGKSFLRDPKDVLNLALASKSLYDTLHVELLTIEVRTTYHRQLQRDQTNGRYDEEYLGLFDANRVPLVVHRKLIRDRSILVRPMPLLHTLIRHGRIAAAEKLIDVAKIHWPFYLETKMNNGITPILLAAFLGYTEIVSSLHKAGCLLKTFAEPGLHHIDLITLESDLSLIEVMRSFPVTGDCLGMAIARGHTALGCWLIRETDLITSQERSWQYITEKLSLAAWTNNVEIAAVLLDMLPTPMEELSSLIGYSPLHLALLYRGRSSMIRLLLEHRAEVNIEDNIRRQTPLHYAVTLNDPEYCELLLSAGAKPTSRDSQYDSVLDRVSRHNDMYLLARAIAEKSEPVNILFSLTRSLPRYQEEASETLKLLITCLTQKCASRNITASALYADAIAPRRGGALLETGQFHLGYTLLHLVLRSTHPRIDILECLLDTKFDDINRRDAFGFTALEMAIHNGHAEAAKVLRRHAAHST